MPNNVPTFLQTLTLAITLVLALSLPAAANEPERYGVIRETNLQKHWVTIDTRRLIITPRTEIRNLAIGANNPRALQTGRPVLFNANAQHELLEIWIYPRDIEQRRKLLGDQMIERHP